MENLLMRLKSLEGIPETPALPEGYLLREYVPSDLNLLSELLQAAFPEMDWNTAAVEAKLIDAVDVKKTFVIEHQSKLVATASARLTEEHVGSGYLHWVAVCPNQRGIGLGRAVSIAVLNEFKDSGCADAVLETQDSRLPAIKIYKKLGFAEEHVHTSHALRWAMIAELLASAGL